MHPQRTTTQPPTLRGSHHQIIHIHRLRYIQHLPKHKMAVVVLILIGVIIRHIIVRIIQVIRWHRWVSTCLFMVVITVIVFGEKVRKLDCFWKRLYYLFISIVELSVIVVDLQNGVFVGRFTMVCNRFVLCISCAHF